MLLAEKLPHHLHPQTIQYTRAGREAQSPSAGREAPLLLTYPGTVTTYLPADLTYLLTHGASGRASLLNSGVLGASSNCFVPWR